MTLRQQVIDAVFPCLTAAACKIYAWFRPSNFIASNLVADIPNAMANLRPDFRAKKSVRCAGGSREPILWRCCQTNAPKHQYSFDEYFYEVTKERHSLRTASLLSLNVLRFESDLCELNRL